MRLDSKSTSPPGILRLRHGFTHFTTLGGVETVLRHHHRLDPEMGIDSEFLIYREGIDEPRVRGIGILAGDTIREIGRKTSRATTAGPERVALYHILWGLPMIAPHDHSSRRILLLHGHYPGLWGQLHRFEKYLDGILCVNRVLRDEVRAAVPRLGAERVEVIGIPITPPAPPNLDRGCSQPVRLAFSARLLIEQKRVDRIPEFCRELERLGVDYHLDILGDGPGRPVLDGALDPKRSTLHGRLEGDRYWAVLRECDFLLFFSDYEGTPISLLEGGSQGVPPIYPELRSGGDHYARGCSPRLLYPPGDLKQAAEAIQWAAALPAAEMATMRKRIHAAVSSHSIPEYMRALREFGARIAAAPRVSSSTAPLPHRALGFLTLAQVDRLAGAARKALRRE